MSPPFSWRTLEGSYHIICDASFLAVNMFLRTGEYVAFDFEKFSILCSYLIYG